MNEAVELLKRLVATPSPSRREEATAALLYEWLDQRGAQPRREGNNIWAVAPGYDSARPTLLLNSHHDTVDPVSSYTRDPYSPDIVDGRLYGLGSNDAGGSVVALANAFMALRDQPRNVNLILALTAEEEVSGADGVSRLLPVIAAEGYHIDMGLVGEPTSLQPAIGERGLVVLDCIAHGRAGHAARNEGDNAIYHAVDDINRLRSMKFDRESQLLGPVKISATMIEAGTRHNVVPDSCRFVVDVRTTDAYTNAETVEFIARRLESDVTPRSTRLSASAIAETHPLVVKTVELGKVPFVSPTMSDMALMHDFPTLKIGPGESSRSHTADEYIMLSEIEEAIVFYQKLIKSL